MSAPGSEADTGGGAAQGPGGQRRRREPGGRGGPRAGARATREAIIASARGLFAARGYAGASVRAIARGAGVDPSLINHYFGGKEGLFGQAMEIPIDPRQVLARFDAADSAEELPGLIVGAFVEIWEGPEAGPQMTALLRRALDDPERFESLIEFLFSALIEPVSARLGGPDPEQARLRMTLVASHLLGTIIARRILRVEPLASLTGDELAELLGPAIRADLNHAGAPGRPHPPASEGGDDSEEEDDHEH